MTERGFVRPRQCIFWREPERARGALKVSFELIETYADESHLRRYLLKCRECAQLYFFEFYEWIDWDEGNDPQYTKFIPLSTAEEGAKLAQLAPFELLGASPCLRIDFPKEAKTPTVYWAGKEA